MSETARVIRTDHGFAWVELDWNEACTSCRGKEICFSGADQKKNAIQVKDSLGVMAGDRVEIEFPAGLRIQSSALVFGVPVLSMLVGYFAGVRLLPAMSQDSAGLLGTLAGLVISLLFVRLLDRKGGLVRRLPVIVGISNEDQASIGCNAAPR